MPIHVEVPTIPKLNLGIEIQRGEPWAWICHDLGIVLGGTEDLKWLSSSSHGNGMCYNSNIVCAFKKFHQKCNTLQ